MADLPGLYAVSIQVACDTKVGGATLDLDLVVHSGDGRVYGRGRIKQAIPPPNGDLPIAVVTGQIRQTGLGSNQLLVSLIGGYAMTAGPTMPLEIYCRMTAALVVDPKTWSGAGSFTYGPSGRNSCPEATVTKTGPK